MHSALLCEDMQRLICHPKRACAMQKHVHRQQVRANRQQKWEEKELLAGLIWSVLVSSVAAGVAPSIGRKQTTAHGTAARANVRAQGVGHACTRVYTH